MKTTKLKAMNFQYKKSTVKSFVFCLLASVIIGLNTGCSKYLEVEPTNVLAVSSYEDIKALMGSYLKSFITTQHKLSGTTIPYKNNKGKMVFQFYSDDLDYEQYLNNPFGRNNRGFFNSSLDWKENTIPGIIWKEYYSNIGFFNTILTELGRLNNTSTEQREVIAGEAKFLRAWYLFKLMQYFTPYHNNEYGLPVNFDAEAVGSYDSKRKTQSEVYSLVISELNEILNYQSAERPGYSVFYDKKIVHALLAQVYHYKGGSGAGQKEDYGLAIEHAKKAMEGRQLDNIADYNPMEAAETGFYKDKPAALIVHIHSAPSNGLQSIIGIPVYQTPSVMQFATNELYNLYSDKDVRKAYFFNPDKSIIKFEHPESYGLDMNFIFRVAELHLIIAESYARMGDTGQAKNWYETFMKNRVTGYQYQGEDVLDALLVERRKEFCFEDDMRWVDLTRIQKGWQRKALDKNDGSTYTLKDGDYRFCFPIPLEEELQYNKIKQNPGWNGL